MQTLIVANQQQRKLHEAGNDHQRITDVAGQPEKHFKLYAQRQVGVPDAPVQLEPNLQDAFGPATLLCFESVDLYRNFRGRFFIKQINESPTHQLRAETEISVFGERVTLPATAQLDRLAPADAGR